MIAIEQIKNKTWFQLPQEVKDWAEDLSKLSFTNKTPAECVEIMIKTHYEENEIRLMLNKLHVGLLEFEFTDANRDYIYPASMKCSLPDLKVINIKKNEFYYWDIKSVWDEMQWERMQDKYIKAAHGASIIVLYNRGDRTVSLVDCNTKQRKIIGYMSRGE